MKKTKTERAVDRAIEQAWYRQASGVQVDILDIPKIFADVRREWTELHLGLEAAVTSAIAKYRRN